jgi:hypothetical protein
MDSPKTGSDLFAARAVMERVDKLAFEDLLRKEDYCISIEDDLESVFWCECQSGLKTECEQRVLYLTQLELETWSDIAWRLAQESVKRL